MSAILDDEGLAQDDPEWPINPTETPTTKLFSSTKRTSNENSGLGDDEELQEILAQRRRQALKRKKSSRAEEIARSIRESAYEEAVRPSEEGDLIIDETSEFIRGLEMSQLDRAASRDKMQTGEPSPEKMDIEENLVENTDIDMPDMSGMPENTDTSDVRTAILQDEPIIGGSLAATLAALRRTGN